MTKHPRWKWVLEWLGAVVECRRTRDQPLNVHRRGTTATWDPQTDPGYQRYKRAQDKVWRWPWAARLLQRWKVI